jgi:parallel beta-helix repeat protein
MKESILLITFLLCLGSRVNCTNYYFSSSRGNDNWSGRLQEPNASRTDGPKNSLQALINLLNQTVGAGDSVWMARSDTWTSAQGIELRSANGSPSQYLFLGAYGKGALPVIYFDGPGNVLTCRGSDTDPSSFLHIRQITLSTRSTTNRPTGLWVGESWYPNKPHHILLDGLQISDCNSGMILYDQDITVQNCLFINNGNGNAGHGIFCSAKNVIIRNNVLDNNGSGSVFVHSMYISQSENVLIEGNEIKNADDGLKLRTTNNLIVRNNIIHDTRIHTIHLGGDEGGGMRNVIIEGNILYNAPQGLRIASESGNQRLLTENVMVRNNLFPAMVQISSNGPVKDIYFFNNLFHSTNNQPTLLICQAIQPINVQVRNNIFYKITPQTGHSLITFQASSGLSGVMLDHNLYHFPVQSQNLITVGNQNFNSLSTFRNQYPMQERNGQNGDPNFVNPPFDFHLSAASLLAIDRGVDLTGIVELDLDGRIRPQDGDGVGGAAFDIGPYEFCCFTSIVEEQNGPGFIRITPNPVRDRLIINHRGVHLNRISIWSVVGIEIKSFVAEQEITELDLNELLPGYYFMNAWSIDQRLHSIPFVKW